MTNAPIHRTRTLEPYRWATVFATLSLDIAAPYSSAMGLQLPPGESFVNGLRDVIRRFREAAKSDSGVEMQFDRSAFDWLESEFGSAFAQQLYYWGTEIFQSGDAPGTNAFLWDNVIRYGGLDGARDAVPAPPFIQSVRSEMAKTPPQALYKIQPATAWDQELYQRNGYTEFRNPMELVQATVNYCTFVRAWSEAATVMGPIDTHSEVRGWGIRIARELKMPLDRLGEPGDWKPLPPLWRN